MKAILKNILKHGSIYFFSNALTKAFGFFLIPIYTAYLSPADYGILNIVNLTSNFIFIICSLGLLGAISRFFFDFKDREPDQKKYLGNILSFILTISLLVLTLLFFFGEKLFYKIFPDVDFYPFIAFALCITFFKLFREAKLNIFRMRQQPVYYSLLSSGYFILNLTFTVVVLVVLKYGVLGKVTSDVLLGFIFFIIALVLLSKDVTPSFDLKKIKGPLKYSLPLVPHMLSGFILYGIDRIYLANLLSMKEVGIYSLAGNLSAIMLMITNAFMMVYGPFFYKEALENEKTARSIFSRITTYYFMFVFFCGILLTFFSSELIMLLSGKEYQDAQMVLPALIFTQVFNGLYFIFVHPLFFVKSATKYVSVVTFVAAGTNIVLNYILIKNFGMMGAAWATLIATIFTPILAFFFAQRVYKINYQYSRIAIIIAVSSLLIISFYFTQFIDLSLWPLVGLKVLLLLCYFLFLYLFQFYSAAERDFIKRMIEKNS